MSGSRIASAPANSFSAVRRRDSGSTLSFFSTRRVPSGLSSSTAHALLTAVLLAQGGLLSAQAPPETAPEEKLEGKADMLADGGLAIVGVHVVPMDAPTVLRDHTVVVRGQRIVALGPESEVEIPDDVRVVDGRGRYLAPGLADLHVHLDEGLGNRPDFGDAPLYLAHGVTTVLNLRGDGTHLEWRRRIEAGELLAPSLFTAGEFLNEPFATTPEEVAAEVARQVEAGFDVIKFHEFFSAEEGRYLTTVGLSRDAFGRMMKAARMFEVPLVGHAPHNLPFDTVLEEGMHLAHLNTFLEHHFVPDGTPAFQRAARATKWGCLAVLPVVAAGVLASVLRRRRPSRADASFAAAAVLTALLFLVLWERTAWAGDDGRITMLFVSGLMVAIVALLAAIGVVRPNAQSPWMRLYRTALALALGSVAVSLTYWLPLAWRNREQALEDMARRARESGVQVITTLIVDSPSWLESELPERRYLSATTRWKDWRPPPPSSALLAPDPLVSQWNILEGKLVRRLQDAGVPLLLGTDAMGLPLMIPGITLHEELRLLTAAGLTPFEALQTTTVRPAALLGARSDFGTIAIGKRADLLLVDGDPLEDLSHLQRPAGVSLRGHWLSRAYLQRMLEGLVEQ